MQPLSTGLAVLKARSNGYYTQGSVIVDFVEPTSNQLIWRGRVTDTVNGLDQSEKQINKGAKQLVKIS
jgi:hypothetical protein